MGKRCKKLPIDISSSIADVPMIEERQVWVKQISMRTASPGSEGKEVKDNIYSSQGRYNRLTFK